MMNYVVCCLFKEISVCHNPVAQCPEIKVQINMAIPSHHLSSVENMGGGIS